MRLNRTGVPETLVGGKKPAHQKHAQYDWKSLLQSGGNNFVIGVCYSSLFVSTLPNITDD